MGIWTTIGVIANVVCAICAIISLMRNNANGK